MSTKQKPVVTSNNNVVKPFITWGNTLGSNQVEPVVNPQPVMVTEEQWVQNYNDYYLGFGSTPTKVMEGTGVINQYPLQCKYIHLLGLVYQSTVNGVKVTVDQVLLGFNKQSTPINITVTVPHGDGKVPQTITFTNHQLIQWGIQYYTRTNKSLQWTLQNTKNEVRNIYRLVTRINPTYGLGNNHYLHKTPTVIQPGKVK